jgi:hypothetical protein
VGRTVLLVAVMLGALRDPCGTDTAAAGLLAPCTRSSDCEKSLVCLSGVCALPDAGASDGGGSHDGDARDASALDGNAAD